MLRESDQLFRSLTENSFAAVFIVQNGKYRYINTSAIAYAGYTAEELIGQDSHIIVHPDDREMVKKKAREMLQGRDSTPYEFRMVTKQGGIRFIIQLVSSIQYNGKPAILGNAIDVTERKQAEEALRESERRLTDIIDFLPDATLAIDRQGKVIAWNRAIEEMTGVKAHEMLGKGDYEYALPFYAVRRPILLDLVLKPDKKIERSYYSILEKQKDLLIVETWVPYLKWRKAFLWAKASPLYDSRGDIVGAIESIRDITERKQLEELLRMSEETYRQLFATVPDAIFMFDADTRQFIDANESALRLYGYSREEFLKMTLADITAEPEESEKVVKKTMAVRMDRVPLRYHIKKDKTVFPVEASTSMFDLGGRKVICVVIRDITKRNQAEEVLGKREIELEAKTSELEDLNAALRVLLKQREEDRNEFEQKVLSNVKVLILPHIEKLKIHMDMKNMTYLNVLESNLKEIISPFAKKLSAQYLNLTNREVQVANLIKEGKTTKEIASFLNVSDSAVNVYRYHIRRKLSLTKKHNLRSYMSSIV